MLAVSGLGHKVSKLIKVKWLPWAIVGLTLLVALFHEIFQPPWIGSIPRATQITIWAMALVVLILGYLIVERVVYYLEQREKLRRRVEEAERLVAEAYQRLQAIFRISQKFVEASDENEVIELVLKLSVDLIGASGASYVPLDEHGQSLTAISYGELPPQVVNDWVEYLATPAVRERCRTCADHGTLTSNSTCPLFRGPFSDAVGLFCLPLLRGEKEFGVLNLFVQDSERLDAETQAFLRAMIDETALALEGVRLRRRELAALQQMQAVREKTDLKALLTSLLEDVHQTLESDFAMLSMQESSRELSWVTAGDYPEQAQVFLNGVLQGVISSKEPLLLGEVSGESSSGPGVKSLMAAPLFSPERIPLGALLVGNWRQASFNQRQLALLQTVAGQVALVVQNANLMAELEYKTIIQERTRLAREIHDGLAQTLGFLKLHTAQMQNYLGRGEMERLQRSIDQSYSILSEAYQDARQAIDGLRISTHENGVVGWLEQIASEFGELSGLNLVLEQTDADCMLLPEVHAQLIRIVQEALSNVRKHAQAERVWIACQQVEGDLYLEIRDDGRGFSAEDVPATSRHGLRGMRERAELIGADFQVISRPNEGTIVRVRLPLMDAVNMHSGGSNR